MSFVVCLSFIFYFHQSKPPQVKFNSRATDPTNPHIQPPLPTLCPSQASQHPASPSIQKNTRTEITVCDAALWETLPSLSRAEFALLVPPYLFSHSTTVLDGFEWGLF